jgi:FkbM family methyltransferase
MQKYSITILQQLNYLLEQHPEMACSIEKLAAIAQGKGYVPDDIEVEIEALVSLFDTPPVLAIDVGANVGNYSLGLLKRFANLEIHAFEPSAVNCKKLLLTFQQAPSFNLVPSALGSKAENAVLFSDMPGSGLSSLTKRNLSHHQIPFEPREIVSVVRFDHYWENILKRRPIDLVKIDVEGHEFDALLGFGDALSYTSAIQFEIGSTNIDTRIFFKDLFFLLKSFEFSIFRLTPSGLSEIRNYGEDEESFSYQTMFARKKIRH